MLEVISAKAKRSCCSLSVLSIHVLFDVQRSVPSSLFRVKVDDLQVPIYRSYDQ